jgi:integrase
MGRTAKTQRLTALAVRKYAAAPSAHAPLHDGGGLYLRKRGTALHWTLRLTDPASGAEQWHRLFPDDPLGTYRHKGLADARAEARRLWSTRSSGIDPRAERQRQIRARVEADAQERLAHERRITVRALFDRWAATDLQPRVLADGTRLGRKDAGAFTKAQFERRVFPKIGSVAVEDVQRADLLTILDGAKAEGKLRTANVLLSDIKQMFRFALMRDLVVRNPLDTVGKREVGGPSVERDRVLSPEEIQQLSAALLGSRLQQRFVAGVWIILSTGARVGELIGATWSGRGHDPARLQTVAEKSGVKLGFVEIDRRTWYLPETKNQRDHTIHLSDFALHHFRALAALQELDPNNPNSAVPWVFPGIGGKGPVGLKTFGKQLSDRQREPQRRLPGRTKETSSLLLPGGRWTAHDLRRTAATLMASLGISGDVIDECLNHIIESRVRRTYVRDRRSAEQARAFEALGARLQSLTTEVQARKPARRAKRDAVENGVKDVLPA